jgi:serine/threonine protein kinase
MWSLGILLYELTTLRLPFHSENMEELYRLVQRGTYQKIPSNFSKELSLMIAALLQVDSKRRPSCERILSERNVIQRIDEGFLRVPLEHSRLLQTFHFTSKMRLNPPLLPQANYSPVHYKNISKREYLNALLDAPESDVSGNFLEVLSLKPSFFSTQAETLLCQRKAGSFRLFIARTKREESLMSCDYTRTA